MYKPAKAGKKLEEITMKKKIDHIALRAIVAFVVMTATVITALAILHSLVPDWETKLADLARTDWGGIALVCIAMFLLVLLIAGSVSSILFGTLLTVTISMGEKKFIRHLACGIVLTMGGLALFCWLWSTTFNGVDIEVTEAALGAATAFCTTFVWALEAHTENQEVAR